jgi:hypothetical protein
MNLIWLPALLTAVGIGLLALALGRVAASLLAWRSRRRLWSGLRARHEPSGPLPVEALFGIPPLAPWMLGAGLLGLVFGQVLLTGPGQLLGPLAGLLPWLWKQARIREGRRQVRRDVTDLVETLRLYLAFAPTPGAALTLALAEQREGVLWARLHAHRDVLALEGPAALLTQVAGELESADLRRLLGRIRAAQAGSLGFAPALRAAADELAAELHRELAEVVESAPTKLIMPILVFLMPPALVVTLAPPVQALLDTLAGAGPVPGM